MTKKLEIYQCPNCGNTIEVVLEGIGELVCCGQKMNLLTPKTIEDKENQEKHLPYFEKTENEFLIKIGETEHTMEEEHYIQFIEAISKDKKYIKRKYLNPKEEPVLKLKCLDKGDLSAIEYCNVHGLWENKFSS